MDLEEILTKVGLDEKEAKYTLPYWISAARKSTRSPKGWRKRPTAYVVLEQLYAKNFVVKTYHQRGFYSAESPISFCAR